MSESKNLKNYRCGICKAKKLAEISMNIIPFILTFIGAIFFVDTGIQKIIIFLCLNAIFLGVYLILQNYVKAINVDDQYLNEDIIRLHEISYDYENLKRSVKESQDKALKVTPFMAALDYTVKELSELLLIDNISYEDFKLKINNILYNVNKVIYYFYKDYQEELTLALYYYSDATDEFYDYISYEAKAEASPKIKGRIWQGTDEAHICYVARHRETNEFIFNDLNNNLPKPENYKSGDENTYVSSISIPIFYNENERIRAVLSLTSNMKNRFNLKHPTDIIDNNINTIFVRTFYSIAKLIEIAFNKIYPQSEKLILLDILKNYQELQKLNKKQTEYLEDLSR